MCSVIFSSHSNYLDHLYLLRILLITGQGLRATYSENVGRINLNKETLYIREHGEGPMFSHLKLAAISDEALFIYLTKMKELFQENPKCKTTSFLTHHFWQKSLKVTAKTVKNELVYEIIVHGGYYGILIDTTTDVSGKTQLSIVVKYVCTSEEDGFTIKERTIGFKHITNTSGKEIYNVVIDCLTEAGLCPKKVTGNYRFFFMVAYV